MWLAGSADRTEAPHPMSPMIAQRPRWNRSLRNRFDKLINRSNGEALTHAVTAELESYTACGQGHPANVHKPISTIRRRDPLRRRAKCLNRHLEIPYDLTTRRRFGWREQPAGIVQAKLVDSALYVVVLAVSDRNAWRDCTRDNDF